MTMGSSGLAGFARIELNAPDGSRRSCDGQDWSRCITAYRQEMKRDEEMKLRYFRVTRPLIIRERRKLWNQERNRELWNQETNRYTI